jgi:hypothetical protein
MVTPVATTLTTDSAVAKFVFARGSRWFMLYSFSFVVN